MTMPEERHSTRAELWAERKFSGKSMRPRDAARLIAAVWLIAVLLFGIIERIADPSTFPSVWLGFWWAIQTVTTVGYGDVVPHQTSGKALAAILMLGGLSILSILTATITSAFVARRENELRAAGDDPVMQKLNQIAERLDMMDVELQGRREDRRPD